MIKNIVFDMGNVLIHFDPDLFIERYSVSDSDKDLLKKVIFESNEWLEMDRGVLSEEEACVRFEERLPEHLHETTRNLVTNWHDPLIEIEGMAELVKELKEAGYNIFILSNAASNQKAYWKRYSAKEYFDGTFISYETQELKPETDIYNSFFDRFSLDPNECFFIDDKDYNIEAGKALGMDGYVFDGDVDKLRVELSQKEIL